MMKKNTVLAIVLCIAMIIGLGGCASVSAVDIDEPITGGVTDKTDPNAPKVIESKDIDNMHAEFLLYGEWAPGLKNYKYTFDIKPNEQGVLTAYESGLGLSAPVDQELLDAIQAVIDKFDLVDRNGVYKLTAGLPPEFGTCTFNVNYTSKENLSFTIDNEPDAEWAKQLYLVFAAWFAKSGIESLIPPQDSSAVASCSVSFTEDDVRYSYGAWHQKDSGNPDKLQKEVTNIKTNKVIYSGDVPVPKDYIDNINEILTAFDLTTFDPYPVLNSLGTTEVTAEGDPWDQTLAIEVDYENGQRFVIETSAEEEIEKLRPMVDELIMYYDTLFPGMKNKLE